MPYTIRPFFIATLALSLAACSTDAPSPDQAGVDASTQVEGRRWLAGDHHMHSQFSVGYEEGDPPKPVVGGDAIYPIPKNAAMARQFGLDWTVATDHGGPNHSKVHLELAYPELLQSRAALPDVIQFFGMELNTPGADHSSIIVPHMDNEAEHLAHAEARFDKHETWPPDSTRDREPLMLDALDLLQTWPKKPVVIAHHPSRSAPNVGEYGLTAPAELRAWNDRAPDIAVGMEGAPGHQAAAVAPEPRARGAYGRGYPTLGGFDQMTARLGGFWDSMLSEGRRWWITANSDSHVHHTEGGIDFWPGEYSKTWVYAEKTYDDILDGIREGRVFVTLGDLVSELYVTAHGADGMADIGGTLHVAPGEEVTVRIRLKDPEVRNGGGQDPAVARVDLIAGEITGPAGDPSADRHPSTRVIARFDALTWQRDGEYRVMEHTLEVDGPMYFRVRGTNTDQLEPEPDLPGENPWSDLWFYANPVFVTVPQG